MDEPDIDRLIRAHRRRQRLLDHATATSTAGGTWTTTYGDSDRRAPDSAYAVTWCTEPACDGKCGGYYHDRKVRSWRGPVEKVYPDDL
jgi:hypothetical protein